MIETVETVLLEYRRPGVLRTKRLRSFGEETSKLALLATLFTGYGLGADPEKGADLFFIAGLLLWVGIAAALLMRSMRRRQTQFPIDPIRLRWRIALCLLLMATFASFPLTLGHYHGCPHGERWANNLFGVARSSSGGPCGNGWYERGRWVWHVGGNWYLYIPQHRWAS